MSEKVSSVSLALVTLATKPAGVFDTATFEAAIKSSLLLPLNVSPVKVSVIVLPILPSFADASLNVESEKAIEAGSIKSSNMSERLKFVTLLAVVLLVNALLANVRVRSLTSSVLA